jgi:hypothetical protein
VVSPVSDVVMVSVPELLVSVLEPSVELVDAELPPSSPQAVSTSVEIRNPHRPSGARPPC